MVSKKVQRKFKHKGRQAAFARFAGVSEASVSLWLAGKSVSAPLDRLAKNWNPNAPIEQPAAAAATQAA